MRNKIIAPLAGLLVLGLPFKVWSQGTAFTYQGYLNDAGIGANGLYDLQFTLFDTDSGGVALVKPLATNGVVVSNGLFTVSIDFGSSGFDGTHLWLEIGVQTNGGGGFANLAPRTKVTPTPYAIFSTTAGGVASNSVGAAEVVDNSLTAADLAANSVGASEIATGAVGTSEIADGSVTVNDLNLASVDGRYVLKAGDTMTGDLTTPNLTVSGALGIGTASPSNSLHVYDSGNEGDIIVENLYPFITLKQSGSNNNAGLLFADTNGYTGWLYYRGSDQAISMGSTVYSVTPDTLVLQRDGNAGIGTTQAFTRLTVKGSLGFKNPADPAMYIYESGTANNLKPVIVHSPTYPWWGMFYQDSTDRFYWGANTTNSPAMVVDLFNRWVAINTPVPATGYALSVDGKIACEDVLVQDSSSWPDYVFAENYPLKPLSEVEAHIKENKHLPGIPTADELAATGISVGDMQKRMMEKIEELTLYAIEQNKRLAAQEKKISELQSQLEETQP